MDWEPIQFAFVPRFGYGEYRLVSAAHSVAVDVANGVARSPGAGALVAHFPDFVEFSPGRKRLTVFYSHVIGKAAFIGAVGW